MSWQSLSNMAYMSYFLAAKSVPVIAFSASVVFAISPWGTVKTIQQARSTLQFQFAPFFFYFVSSVIYTLYALVTWNALMGSTALLGAVLGAYYVAVFYTYAPDKTQPTRMLTYAFTFIVALAIAVTLLPSSTALLIGVPGNILSIATSASPLLQLPAIVKRRDASSLPVGMSVMTVVAGGVWMVYGFMLGDKLVILPNLFALLMGLMQVTLILLFPGAGAVKGHQMEHSMATASAAVNTTEHASPKAAAKEAQDAAGVSSKKATDAAVAARGRNKAAGGAGGADRA